MKYLLQAIEAKRSSIKLNDSDLRRLLTEVRKGRDEREEFLESIDRIITELKNYSEHSQAFLTKVSKRDAPDYYDVIKHPMDLGTMQKKIKSGQYKNKKQFAHDLDLIWDNCLTYNSDPSHPLRRNVQFMRKKANHLLEFISDKSDVKDALIQWEANEAAMGKVQEVEVNGDADGAKGFGFGAGSSASRFASPKVASTEKQPPATSLSATRRRMQSDVPFEQMPALLRTAHGMSTFMDLDTSIAAIEAQTFPSFYAESFSQRPPGDESGPSSRPMDATNSEDPHTCRDKVFSIFDSLRERILPDPFSAALDPTLVTSLLKGKARESPRPGFCEDLELSGGWWAACSADDLLGAGLPALPSSEMIRVRDRSGANGKPRKKRRKPHQIPPTQRSGMQGLVARNVRTIQKLQETHAKFVALASAVESDAPLPAHLAHVSSDEESDDYPSAAEEEEDEEEVRIAVEGKNPFSRINCSSARENISWNAQSLLAHQGFEGSQKAAVDVLSDVMTEFLMNMGRTLRLYSDRYARKMSAEEMILHSLQESAGTDVPGLERYIRDDVERYGIKMSDLLRRLRQSYKDQLQQTTDRAAFEDEALFADDGEALMSGNFAEELGDDFFGFKEMGLDRELGLSALTVPGRLFHGRGPSRANALVKGANTEPELPYPPPPPFVPLTSAGISAQIGLLQPWYKEKLWDHRARVRMADTVDEGEDREVAADTLPDEEAERQRYKVPPTGKMPRRTMWGSAAPEKPASSLSSSFGQKTGNAAETTKSLATKVSSANSIKRKRTGSVAVAS
ncbi:hypothetical protein IE53DRAFT_368416 [Violaceomyces palustris]|uniref:Uncharacterized protein n=1 Tax=Violaceomyces palustris TaxID=1673888 RepID=A0ACD0NYR2_9BASI|nr:hypothetical protein IE53DRAFT_368416 [Violaceomyces palustris]